MVKLRYKIPFIVAFTGAMVVAVSARGVDGTTRLDFAPPSYAPAAPVVVTSTAPVPYSLLRGLKCWTPESRPPGVFTPWIIVRPWYGAEPYKTSFGWAWGRNTDDNPANNVIVLRQCVVSK